MNLNPESMKKNEEMLPEASELQKSTQITQEQPPSFLIRIFRYIADNVSEDGRWYN